MSEEILKALMQLFAIISKQDEGTTANQREFVVSFLSSQLNKEKVEEYLKLYDEKAGLNKPEGEGEKVKVRDSKLTTMKDSVRTLALCRKINKTLSQKQKVVVLIRIFELLKTDELYTEQRMEIIETVAKVFNIEAQELELVNNFSRYDDLEKLNSEEILVVDNRDVDTDQEQIKYKHIKSVGLDDKIICLRIMSTDLYFVKYKGHSEISLNGLTFNVNNLYILPHGSTFRLPKGTLYYSDVVSRFLKDDNLQRISFKCEDLSFEFPGGKKALNHVTIREEFGLVGIMGASGSGKTTLINTLSGSAVPSDGVVEINGVDIHKQPEDAKGLIGYIAQDDLLFDELTVFDNLYYSAKLCFKNLNNEELNEKVEKTLQSLGLWEARDVKVGNPLNKKISGGQRKRLNIALELIREPAVLFVDEPTSGLSSKDSENVMDLLKELSLSMKLIFVVIHQPSSDIFKMFDKLFILDTGGFPIYYGNPIESIIYFKTITNQLNADVGECHVCGNVNPEMLFNIIESKEVDDFGRFTINRLKSPKDWNDLYLTNHKDPDIETVKEKPEKLMNIPGKLKQMSIFTKRDILSKIGNLQYILINLLEAPVLALLLTVIIKYASGENGEYYFLDNANVPPYLFMSITIALFIGLSVSAEEIFRDRKILKREKFLNLSRSSYLLSKVLILSVLSAFQTLTYVLLGNWILEIQGLFFEYWIVLFVSSVFANLLGLNISSAFNSAATIYILIPFLVIPQMILGGAMFSFDNLNSLIGGGKHTSPVIADAMISRWAYEALAVTHFMDNKYEENFYDLEKIESMSNYKQAYFIPELERIIDENRSYINDPEGNSKIDIIENIEILKNELNDEVSLLRLEPKFDLQMINKESYTIGLGEQIDELLEEISLRYATIYSKTGEKKNKIISYMIENGWNGDTYDELINSHTNDFLTNLVKKTTSSEKIKRVDGHLLQLIDPVFQDPDTDEFLSMRAIFYAPTKMLFGKQVSTLLFNVLVILLFSIILYITLYYDLLSKLLNSFSKNKG